MTDRIVPDPGIFDTTPAGLRDRFAQRMLRLLREGRDPTVAARLAASYAFRANPALRLEPPAASNFADAIFRLGCELNADQRDRLARVH